MITGGRNLGRVGLVMHRERHPGSFDIVHVKDSAGKRELLEIKELLKSMIGNRVFGELKLTVWESADENKPNF